MAAASSVTSEADQRRLYFNGVSGLTGEYLTPPLRQHDIAELIRSRPRDSRAETWLKLVWRKLSHPHLGLPFEYNPEVLDDAGWGIVFHEHEHAAVKSALAPRIEHRESQIKHALQLT